jgi:Ca-activated chloride channel family protein
MNTVILDAGDSGAVSIGASPETTDALVVRVGEGTMKLKVTYVAPSRTGPYAEPASEPAAATPAADENAELSAPESAEIATRVEINWQGPANRDDFIAIARPNQAPGAYVERTLVREGNPLKVWTPSDPGDYEVRYVVARGFKVLAKAPLAVTAVPAKVEPAGPVNVGGWVEVKWEGPARDGDFISVASANQAPGASISRTPVKEGNPLKVRAASDAGDYEVRYVLVRGYRQLAKATVKVNAVTAEVTPPATAAVGAEFEVAWKGPGYPEDYVTIARTIQAPGAYLNSTNVKRGNPLKLRAPKEPGTYEVRYILGRGHRLLGKATITIAAP